MEHNKICLVIPSLQAGGMERVMSELLNNFSKDKSLRIHLILYGIKRDVFYPLPSEVVLHKPSFLFNNRIRVFSTIRTLIYLRREIKTIKPRSVLSFGELWNNFVLLALIGTKVPVVISDRCQPDKSLGRVNDVLRNWLYPAAHAIVCQTEMACLIYKKKLGDLNYITIGNPIREIVVSESIVKEKIILSVGRLIKSKNFDQLITIFAALNATDWKLVIVGADALKQRNKALLERQIDVLGVKDKVVLTGEQLDVEAYYQRASIFAFTSSSEGFPNVIGEAMSAGLPIVAYDCLAGPSDLISDNETGFLIPLFDQKKFSQKLMVLMQNDDLRARLGKNAQIKIKKFDAVSISEQFLKVMLK